MWDGEHWQVMYDDGIDVKQITRYPKPRGSNAVRTANESSMLHNSDLMNGELNPMTLIQAR